MEDSRILVTPPMSLVDLWSLETTVFLDHSTLLGGSQCSLVFWVNPGISCGTVFLWWILVSLGAPSVLGDLHVLADHSAIVGSKHPCWTSVSLVGHRWYVMAHARMSVCAHLLGSV